MQPDARYWDTCVDVHLDGSKPIDWVIAHRNARTSRGPPRGLLVSFTGFDLVLFTVMP
jgi:hypothetical protein